jgi:hypothetical protein
MAKLARRIAKTTATIAYGPIHVATVDTSRRARLVLAVIVIASEIEIPDSRATGARGVADALLFNEVLDTK